MEHDEDSLIFELSQGTIEDGIIAMSDKPALVPVMQ